MLNHGDKIEFSVNRYGYTVDGIRLRRTTSVTGSLPKPWMGRWAANTAAKYVVDNWDVLSELSDRERERLIKEAPWDKRDDAADRGTLVHNTVEVFATGGKFPTDLPDDESRCVQNVARFLETNDVDIHGAEVTLVNLTHGIAGTCDLWCDMHDASWIIDWKTSKDVYREHALQQVIYNNAEFVLTNRTEIGRDHWIAEVLEWEPVDRLGIVHVTPVNAELYPINPEEVERMWTVARAANHIKSWLVDTDDYRREPKVKVFEDSIRLPQQEQTAA